MPWTGASPAARCRLIGAAALVLTSGVVPARALCAESGALDLPQIIRDAGERFGVPAAWIVAVMRRESGFDARAVSPAGAVGLMQLMPQTYAELRVRYGLGADPFRPQDNVLAGAAYLREMYDRFGADGFLAAYNAGPGRYAQHLSGRGLPSETQVYVARLAPAIAGPDGAMGHRARPAVSSIFVHLTARLPAAAEQGPTAPVGLFAPLTSPESR